VAISQETSQGELDDLRRSLQIKVGVSAAFGIGILILGFFYVLNLIRKNRLLEQSRLAAERRSYVGLLASGLAHEIRNPLNAMNMNLQMLEEELQGGATTESADWADLLTSTKSEIKRLERLVNNFLAYARPADPRFEPRDLNVVLEEVAKFLQADFRQSAVNLALELEPLLPTVEIDVTQLKQALMNLLVNARQVLRSGGTVVLRSRAGAGGEAVIEVEDDGPGIAPEDREKIFQVFYSNRGGGTGLGLPIARQIVERHGGTLEAAAGEERGTVFRIRVPRRHAEAPVVPSRSPAGGPR
jgi:signal transduction histidine kinase